MDHNGAGNLYTRVVYADSAYTTRNSVQNGFQFKSTRTKLSTATHYIPCPGLQMYQSEFGGLQGRAIASSFKVVWPKCTSECASRGVWGYAPPGKLLFILDAKRSLLMQFLGPKSHMFCNSYPYFL